MGENPEGQTGGQPESPPSEPKKEQQMGGQASSSGSKKEEKKGSRLFGRFKSAIKGKLPKPPEEPNPSRPEAPEGQTPSEGAAPKNWEQEYYKNLVEQQYKESKKQYGHEIRSLTKNLLLILIILVMFVGVPVYMFFSHSGAFSYQIESYYSPYFSAITTFISPLISQTLFSFSCLANPIGCVTTPVTNVSHTSPTFTSFLSVTPPSSTQIAYTGQQNYIYYILQNTGNVVLGPNRPNSFLINYSCGTDQLCQQLTSLGTSYQIDNNPETLYPGNSVQQSFSLSAQCPASKTLASQLPVQIQLDVTTRVTNYSGASLLPIEYINPTFYDSLLSSSQAFVPSQQFTAFVTPGPLQITPTIQIRQPVIANTPVTLTVQLSNLGTGNYKLNDLWIFLPEWLGNMQIEGGYGLSEVSALNKNFDCAQASGGQMANFIFPSSGYIECSYALNGVSSPSSVVFTLPIPTISIFSHFDTLPILFYANYNYTQSNNLPIIIKNITSCS